MLSPSDAVRAIRRAIENREGPLTILWLTTADRREIAAASAGLTPELPVIIHSLDSRSFENPNALGADIVDVLEKHRSEIERMASIDHLTVVLLSRTELDVADCSSPVEMPVWFPFCAGALVQAEFHNLLAHSLDSLSSNKLASPRLAAALLRMESALQRRITSVLDTSFADAEQFLQYVDTGCSGRDACRRALQRAAERMADCDSLDYRPRADDGLIVEGIWSCTTKLSVRELETAAKKLARALWPNGIDGQISRESLCALLFRPPNWPQTPQKRAAHGILASVGAACQLITVSHHARDYGEYETVLMQSVSFDLRRSLDDSTALVNLSE